jgi:hypothetical protein
MIGSVTIRRNHSREGANYTGMSVYLNVSETGLTEVQRLVPGLLLPHMSP